MSRQMHQRAKFRTQTYVEDKIKTQTSEKLFKQRKIILSYTEAIMRLSRFKKVNKLIYKVK